MEFQQLLKEKINSTFDTDHMQSFFIKMPQQHHIQLQEDDHAERSFLPNSIVAFSTGQIFLIFVIKKGIQSQFPISG